MVIDWLKKELEKYGNPDNLVISWDEFDVIMLEAKTKEEKNIDDVIKELSKKD
jgi:hypothetical protein